MPVEMRTEKAQSVEVKQLGDVTGVKVYLEEEHVELSKRKISQQRTEERLERLTIDSIARPYL